MIDFLCAIPENIGWVIVGLLVGVVVNVAIKMIKTLKKEMQED